MQEDDIRELFRTYQGGRFEVQRILRAGGMGTIISARDTRLNRMCAIKMINPELLAEPEMVKRFENEAAMMAGIDHPNIVRVFDIGEVDGNHLLVLEWVDGGSLADHLKVFAGDPPKGMPPRQALEMVYRICDALQVAHDLGIIHRDIKPDNVLVTKKGVPKVTDFGIARMGEKTSQLTGANQAMGTPGYIPLEQLANAKDVDARADIHALGVMFWALLTAQNPPTEGMFSGNLEDHPDMLDAIPVCLHEIIRRMVALFARDRYGSIRELVAVLKEIEDRLPQNPEDMPIVGYALDVRQYLKEQEAPEPTMIPQAIEATRVARAAVPISSPTITEAYKKLTQPAAMKDVGDKKLPVYGPEVDAQTLAGDWKKIGGDFEIAGRDMQRAMDRAAEVPKPVPEPVSEEVLEQLTMGLVDRVSPLVTAKKKNSLILKISLGICFIGVLALVWAMVHTSGSVLVAAPTQTVLPKPIVEPVITVIKPVLVQKEIVALSPDVISSPDSSDVAGDVSDEDVSTLHPIEPIGTHLTTTQKKGKSEKVGKPERIEPKSVIVKAGETKTFPVKEIAPPKVVNLPTPPKVDVVTVFVSLDVVGDETARVYLVSSHGRFKLPGSVPPGTYRVVSTFKDRDGEVITVEVKENSYLKISCNAAFAKCAKR